MFVVRGQGGHQVWGYKLGACSFFPSEDKLVLEPGTCFKVGEVRTNGLQREVVVDVEPDTPILLGGFADKGRKRWAAGDSETSAKMWKISVDMGSQDGEVMAKLGWCYSNGVGVVQDENKAVALWRRAAEMGNADAMYWLGTLLVNGKIMEQDIARVVEQLQRAADMGSANAVYILAVLYESGTGVAKNEGKASELF